MLKAVLSCFSLKAKKLKDKKLKYVHEVLTIVCVQMQGTEAMQQNWRSWNIRLSEEIKQLRQIVYEMLF